MSIVICPHCKKPLHAEGKSLFCESRHCFDIAKSGFVNLTGPHGSPVSGDDREMVRARSAFLESGAYKPFADKICALAAQYAQGSGEIGILDAGCGEGYYTNNLALSLPNASVYGFDLSKSACEHGAKRAKALSSGAFFGVASVYSLPIADCSVDIAVSLFAPIAEVELARVLKPNGILIVGAAGKRHLFELKQAVYSEVYENEGRRDLPSVDTSRTDTSCSDTSIGFEALQKLKLEYNFDCVGDNIKNLFSMTPYAFKTSQSDRAKLDFIPALRITADFDIFIYRKKN